MPPLLTQKAEYAWATSCPEWKEWRVPVFHHLLAVSGIDLRSRSDRSVRILEQMDHVLTKLRRNSPDGQAMKGDSTAQALQSATLYGLWLLATRPLRLWHYGNLYFKTPKTRKAVHAALAGGSVFTLKNMPLPNVRRLAKPTDAIYFWINCTA
jgi:hypothetical protein